MWIIRTDGYESLSSGRRPVNWERFACGQISHLGRLTLARGPDPVWTVRARSADADLAAPGGGSRVLAGTGYAEDCDEQLRDAISQQRDVELVGEDYDDVVDAVLLWWRDGDGDLFEALVDALTPLADGGYIWLLTPKPGRDNYVEPSEIGEAAPTAGLSQTSSLSAGRDWLGTRLVAPKARR